MDDSDTNYNSAPAKMGSVKSDNIKKNGKVATTKMIEK